MTAAGGRSPAGRGLLSPMDAARAALVPGFGFGEIVVIAVVLLVAVGPKKLPQLMKTMGQGLRQFRDATTELRRASGIDEIMREDPLGTRTPPRRTKNPLGPLTTGAAGAAGAAGAGQAASGAPAHDPVAAGRVDVPMTAEAVRVEYPPEGADVAHARALAARSEPAPDAPAEPAEDAAASADAGEKPA